MNDNEYLSGKQYAKILIGFLLGTSIILSFGLDKLKRDVWIAEFIGGMVGLIILIMSSYIVKKFKNKPIEEILVILLGRLGAKIISIYIMIFSYLLGAFILNNIAVFMNLMLMQETPIWFFVLTMAITSGVILSKGIEILGRIAEVLIPIILALLIFFIIIILFTKFEVNNLRPQFTSSIKEVFRNAVLISTFPYGEMIILLFLNTMIREEKGVYKRGLKGFIVAAIFLIIKPLLVIGVYGANQAASLIYPFFHVARAVEVGEFFSRIEIWMLIIWFITTYIKLSVSIFVCSKNMEYIFKLNSYKDVVLLATISMIPVAIKSYEDYTDFIHFDYEGWILLILPLFAIFIFMFFRALAFKKSDVLR